jgi:hypothetical protein
MRPFTDRNLLTTQNPLAHSQRSVIAARRLLHARLGLPIAIAGVALLSEMLLMGPHGLFRHVNVYMVAMFTVPCIGYAGHFYLCRKRGESLRVSSTAWPKTGHPLENKAPWMLQSRPRALLFCFVSMGLMSWLERFVSPGQMTLWLTPVAAFMTAGYPYAMATTLRMREQWATVLWWFAAGILLIIYPRIEFFPIVAGGLILHGVLLHARFLEIRDAAPHASDDAPLAAQ